MGDSMKEHVMQTIDKYGLINENENIIIGVSGGHDSIALLNVLYEISKKRAFNIYVAHINHGIRGEEADKDEEYVKSICQGLNIPFYSKRVNMNDYAAKHKISSEEAGREIRYSFFQELLAKVGGGKIAVAHNKNDQAETLIMRFLRGTGTDGLKGMHYRNGEIIRPLLDIDRKEIEEYCEINKLNPRVDKTNLEPIYSRNKVRLELIPYIQENFNSGIIDTLARTARLMDADSGYLNHQGIEAYKKVLTNYDNNQIIIDRQKLKGYPYAMKSRVIRNTIENLIGNIKGITEIHINDVIYLSDEAATGKRIYLPHNIIVKVDYNTIIIERLVETKENLKYSYSLDVNKRIYIEELGVYIGSKIVDRKEVDLMSKNRFINYFDYDKIKGDLHIRNRRVGDRFNPSGMKGSKKLKDYFIDEKIPRDVRESIPLLESNGDILWVMGYRSSEGYKVTSNTKKVLVIEYIDQTMLKEE